jgi:hypothetical protein
MEYNILFFTHSGAMKFSRKAKSMDINIELMPVPRVLSSNCSISARIRYDKEIANLIDDEIEKIFISENSENRLIYEAE